MVINSFVPMRKVERDRINRERKIDLFKSSEADKQLHEARKTDKGKVLCRTGPTTVILVYPDDPRLKQQCKIHP